MGYIYCVLIFLLIPLSACHHNGDEGVCAWDILEHIGDGDFGKAARDCWDAYKERCEEYTENDKAQMPKDGI